jgi:AAA family ATP:ADP antiporter
MNAPREPGEIRRLALSFTYFACLLASYYLIRPVRDALAAGLGPDQIKYLATAVFFVMLAIVPVFGWLVARVPRSRLLPGTYAFFVIHLLVFAAVFHAAPDDLWCARVFYVWTTVFNLFVVSVFWSFMADLWSEAQGRRLFGVIAAGGSLGGLAGPAIARLSVGSIGTEGLTLIAAGLLAVTVVLIGLLARDVASDAKRQVPGGRSVARLDEPVGGEILAGLARLAGSPFLLGIAALVALGSVLGMIVYIELAKSAAHAFTTAAARTVFFSQRDLWVNGGSFVLQLLVVGVLSTYLGVRRTLVGSAAIAGVAFLALAIAPVMGVLVAVNVVLRVTEFGIGKPNRDMLYTVVDEETKYKVKNVVDTVVYRGSDVLSGWIHAGLTALGLSLAGLAGVATLIVAALMAIAWGVGTGYRRRGGV